MLPVGWLIAAVGLAILLTMWVTFTLTRLDRLHARVDAAQAALDAQLVRRAAGLLNAADGVGAELGGPQRRELERVARAALSVPPGEDRRGPENAVGRAIIALLEPGRPPDSAAAELREAAARVLIARRFYNDAVRDTRTLRTRRMPRILHLAGRREMPQFFDIDDTVPPPPGASEGRPKPAVAPDAGTEEEL